MRMPSARAVIGVERRVRLRRPTLIVPASGW